MIVSQHGCDPHREDPLAQLLLTTAPMQKAAQLCKDLADELCGGRWVATGGGGYQPYRVLPRAWAIVWLTMTGRALPEHVDPEWIGVWQHASEAPLPDRFLDPVTPASFASAEAMEHNLRRLDNLLKLHSL